MRLLFVSIFAFFFCFGCYRMPEEGEVSLIPMTNNPTITHSQGDLMIPGVTN